MNKIFTTIYFLFAFALVSNAQVLPPDFLCVKNDTLFWDIPTNTCGSFNSYDIFFSPNPEGPFNLLSNVTDENASDYFHANGGGVWYYYISSNLNCPGEPVISSDTLDNLPPEIPIMESASVNSTSIELSWQPSPSPEVIAYIIYRQAPAGVVPIDTVYNATNYIDTDAAPLEKSETYYVLALDACGNVSIFDAPHRTIFLESTIDECDQAVQLSWTLYEGWADGIEANEIWLSQNGEPAQLVGMTNGTTNTYEYSDLTDGDTYCFEVRAVQNATTVRANSNQACVTLDIVQAIQDLAITNVTVTTNNEIEVNWIWNDNAEINTYSVQHSTSNSGYIDVFSETIAPPLPNPNNYIDNSSNPSNSPVYFRIQTTDDCNNSATSTTGSTIFLQGQPTTSQENLLNWTEFNLENTNVTRYQIFRIENGSSTLIGEVGNNITQTLDPVDVNNVQGSICYFVVATANITLPDGTTQQILSKSNEVCVAQNVRVFVPNAFAPRGLNNVFRPLISLGEPAAYRMAIFNRYGQKLFESTDPNIGWNGKYNDRDARAGGYVYVIRVEQANGEIIEKTGSVILLR